MPLLTAVSFKMSVHPAGTRPPSQLRWSPSKHILQNKLSRSVRHFAHSLFAVRWINGVRVGSTGSFDGVVAEDYVSWRQYSITAGLLLQGQHTPNTVAIKIVSLGGTGGRWQEQPPVSPYPLLHSLLCYWGVSRGWAYHCVLATLFLAITARFRMKWYSTPPPLLSLQSPPHSPLPPFHAPASFQAFPSMAVSPVASTTTRCCRMLMCAAGPSTPGQLPTVALSATPWAVWAGTARPSRCQRESIGRLVLPSARTRTESCCIMKRYDRQMSRQGCTVAIAYGHCTLAAKPSMEDERWLVVVGGYRRRLDDDPVTALPSREV